VIGPEGGIADDEIELARASGAISVSLGGRNLRSETAAIAAIAIVMDRLQG
jgi:16S rRNA (uracil1498-N3)-methyltransferase